MNAVEWILLPFVSFFVGSGISLFMFGLEFVTEAFASWPSLVYLLPAAGAIIYGLEKIPRFHNLGDSELILEEIHRPQKVISPLLAPWICIMTWWSHLFGASVGREGTAIQMGASLAESTGLFAQWLAKKMTIPLHLHRPLLLRMGLAGGFAAAFGTPFAAIIFAIEHPGNFHRNLIKEIPILAAVALLSHRVTSFWGISLLSIKQPENFDFTYFPLHWLAISVLFSLVAIIYELGLLKLKQILTPIPRWKVLIGGGVLIALPAFLLGSVEFHGLGQSLIIKSLAGQSHGAEPFYKLILTLLSNAFGFRGGEIVPLMAAGSALGSSLAFHFNLSALNIASAGLAILFSYRMKSPAAGFFFLAERVSFSSAIFAVTALVFGSLFRRFSPKIFQSRSR